MEHCDLPQFAVPPQTDTVIWARMLGAARVADQMEAGGLRRTYANPLKMARLKSLLPITRALYEAKVLTTAKTESERINDIIKHCRGLVETTEARNSTAFTQGVDEEQWNEETCLDRIKQLLVPTTPKTLRPMPPELIGLQLTPPLPVWYLLREAIKEAFLEEVDQRRVDALSFQIATAKRRHPLETSELQPLEGVCIVDAVLVRAPAVVRLLPEGWAAFDKTSELLEALQALVKVAGTRPLVELVERLSEHEYALLGDERDCLAQILEKGYWEPNCKTGRNLVEYVEFVRFLGKDAHVEPVPKRLATPHSTQEELEIAAVIREALPQMDTTAWACMIAAARSAETIETAGTRDVSAAGLKMARLNLLLPIARALYEAKVLPTANTMSQQIDTIIGHCHEFVETPQARKPLESPAFKRGAKEPWNKARCLDAMDELHVPATFKSLRPIKPKLISVHLMPHSPVWNLLRSAINRGMKRTEKSQSKIFYRLMLHAVQERKREQGSEQLLGSVRFVDAFFDCAPALVQSLPERWTSGDLSNELIEAQLAVVKVAGTRPLVELVEELSDKEYALLVEEHSRLSRVLCGDAPSGEYASLLESLGAGASLGPIPPRMATPNSTEEDLEITAVIRQALPQMDTVAWVRMLAAARGGDAINVGRHAVSRLDMLLPVARALYEAKVLPTAKAESARIEAIIKHCHEFLTAKEAHEFLKAEKARKSPAFMRDEETWNMGQCLKAMDKLHVPATFMTLRPAKPEVIGVHLMPHSSLWDLLRNEINRDWKPAERSQSKAFFHLMFHARSVQLLGSVRFFEHIFGCAPAVVRSLPAGWTSGELSNELIEAQLAVVKVAGTRPLVELVQELSDEEYALLVQEHACLSRLLTKGSWAPCCGSKRNRGEYVEFVRFLRQDAKLKGALAEVPPKLIKAEPDADTLAARKRQRLPGGIWESSDEQGIAGERLSVKKEWQRDMNKALNLDSLDEMNGAVVGLGDDLRDQLAQEEQEPVEWPNFRQLPSDLWGNAARLPTSEAWDSWERELENGAAAGLTKLERSASGAAVITRVSVAPLVAAAVLGLVVLAVVFRLRTRQGLGRQS